MLKIRIYSRGGQGGKTAAEIFATTAINKGMEAKTFPEFGPERTGAPTNFYIKIGEGGDKAIRSNEPVEKSDIVLVLDEDLPNVGGIIEHLGKGGTFIFNSSKTPVELKEKFFPKISNIKILSIDATKISFELFGKDFPNISAIGALAKVSGILSLEELAKSVESKFSRLPKEVLEKNIKALKIGYEKI